MAVRNRRSGRAQHRHRADIPANHDIPRAPAAAVSLDSALTPKAAGARLDVWHEFRWFRMTMRRRGQVGSSTPSRTRAAIRRTSSGRWLARIIQALGIEVEADHQHPLIDWAEG